MSISLLINQLIKKEIYKKLIVIFFFLSSILLIIAVSSFFLNLNTTTSDYSWGDVSWIHQAFYNFLHGRPLQTSIYFMAGDGVKVNPFPYTNLLAVHSNYLPYIFAPFYFFLQDINGLYVIYIFYNIIGLSFVTWLIIKNLSDDDHVVKYLFILSIIFSAFYLDIIHYKSQFPLLAGPIILLLFYFLIKGNKIGYIIIGICLSLLSDDIAIYLCCFSGYVFIFYPEMRLTAIGAIIIGMITIFFATFVSQPATKFGMIMETQQSGELINKLLRVFTGEYPIKFVRLREIGIFIIPASILIGVTFRFTKKVSIINVLGIIFITAFSHWFVVLVMGGGHHMYPVAISILLAIIVLVSQMDLEKKDGHSNNVLIKCAFIIIGMFFFINVITIPYISRQVHDINISNSYLTKLIGSNKNILQEINKIPRDKSIVFYTNRGIDGFIANRNDIWRFPHFYDLADYFVIQKDAVLLFYSLEYNNLLSVKDMIHKGKDLSTSDSGVIPYEFVDKIRYELVSVNKTHEIVVDNNTMILFKRIVPYKFIIPDASIGFGWIKNISKMYSNKK